MPSSTVHKEAEGEGGLMELVAAVSHEATCQLMDSLLHDARNPLNALAINLEVLTEKLKDDEGQIPPSQAKNLGAMRDQVFRVDAILKQFSDFLAPRPGPAESEDLGELARRALEVLGHLARKRRVAVRAELEAASGRSRMDGAALRFVILQAMLRALLRSEPGSEVSVSFSSGKSPAVLRVADAGSEAREPAQIQRALVAMCRAHGASLRLSAGECEVTFPA